MKKNLHRSVNGKLKRIEQKCDRIIKLLTSSQSQPYPLWLTDKIEKCARRLSETLKRGYDGR